MKALEKIKNLAGKTWNWLNNKKTIIGLLGMDICTTDFAKDNVSHNTLQIASIVFKGLALIGGGHKIKKDWDSENSTTKKVMNNINKAVNSAKTIIKK